MLNTYNKFYTKYNQFLVEHFGNATKMTDTNV